MKDQIMDSYSWRESTHISLRVNLNLMTYNQSIAIYLEYWWNWFDLIMKLCAACGGWSSIYTENRISTQPDEFEAPTHKNSSLEAAIQDEVVIKLCYYSLSVEMADIMIKMNLIPKSLGRELYNVETAIKRLSCGPPR